MAFERNKKATNPNHRPMSVSNMKHPILEENEKALKLLDEIDKKKKAKNMHNFMQRFKDR